MSIRRNPFEDLERMFERMSRQFEDWEPEWEAMGDIDMSVDVADYDDELVVTADLPGYESDDIDVRLSDSRLHIEAHHEESTGEESGEYLRRERSHRSVSRSLTLPEPVDPDSVSAKYKNGVLTLHMSKVEPAEGTHIDVE